jgi:hypothetical protein
MSITASAPLRENEVALVGTADAGQHPASCGLGELHGRDADAATRAGHQDGLAGLQPAAIKERKPGCLVGQPQGGRAGHREAGGHWIAMLGGNPDGFGEGAVLQLADDAVTHLEAGDAFADCGDDAGEFLARHEGKRRQGLILAGGDQHVGEIEPDSMDVDRHLARCRLRP